MKLFKNMKIETKIKLIKWLFRYHHLRGIPHRSNLGKLAWIYQCDMNDPGLGYAPAYTFHLSKLKNKRFNLLEIGVGGYDNPMMGGASLRMWKAYFSRANVFGIDIYDKSHLEERRIKTFQGHQADENFLERVVAETGGIDVVIDDGSHVSEDVIRSFCFLFPKLNDGGIYVVEDLHMSYYPNYPDPGGELHSLNDVKTAMGYFKSLLDGSYYKHLEVTLPGYEPGYFDKKILSMHFYHNLIFVYKGDNDK